MPSHSQGRKEKWAATATLDEEEEPGQDAQVRTPHGAKPTAVKAREIVGPLEWPAQALLIAASVVYLFHFAADIAATQALWRADIAFGPAAVTFLLLPLLLCAINAALHIPHPKPAWPLAALLTLPLNLASLTLIHIVPTLVDRSRISLDEPNTAQASPSKVVPHGSVRVGAHVTDEEQASEQQPSFSRPARSAAALAAQRINRLFQFELLLRQHRAAYLLIWTVLGTLPMAVVQLVDLAEPTANQTAVTVGAVGSLVSLVVATCELVWYGRPLAAAAAGAQAAATAELPGAPPLPPPRLPARAAQLVHPLAQAILSILRYQAGVVVPTAWQQRAKQQYLILAMQDISTLPRAVRITLLRQAMAREHVTITNAATGTVASIAPRRKASAGRVIPSATLALPPAPHCEARLLEELLQPAVLAAAGTLAPPPPRGAVVTVAAAASAVQLPEPHLPQIASSKTLATLSTSRASSMQGLAGMQGQEVLTPLQLADSQQPCLTLNLSSCEDEGGKPQALVSGLGVMAPALTHLILKDIRLPSEAFVALEDALTASHCQLRFLSLKEVNLSRIGLQHLCTGLASNRSVLELDLSGNKLNQLGPKVPLDLRAMLEKNRSLSKLNLSYTGVGSEAAADILLGAVSSVSLTHLDLSQCHISDQLPASLLRASPSVGPPPLTHLNLGFNWVQDCLPAWLILSLTLFPLLTHLWLDHCSGQPFLGTNSMRRRMQAKQRMTSFERLSCTAEEGEGELDGESLSGTHPSSSAHSRMPDAGLALLAHLHALPHVQDKLRHMQYVDLTGLTMPLEWKAHTTPGLRCSWALARGATATPSLSPLTLTPQSTAQLTEDEDSSWSDLVSLPTTWLQVLHQPGFILDLAALPWQTLSRAQRIVALYAFCGSQRRLLITNMPPHNPSLLTHRASSLSDKGTRTFTSPIGFHNALATPPNPARVHPDMTRMFSGLRSPFAPARPLSSGVTSVDLDRCVTHSGTGLSGHWHLPPLAPTRVHGGASSSHHGGVASNASEIQTAETPVLSSTGTAWPTVNSGDFAGGGFPPRAAPLPPRLHRSPSLPSRPRPPTRGMSGPLLQRQRSDQELVAGGGGGAAGAAARASPVAAGVAGAVPRTYSRSRSGIRRASLLGLPQRASGVATTIGEQSLAPEPSLHTRLAGGDMEQGLGTTISTAEKVTAQHSNCTSQRASTPSQRTSPAGIAWLSPRRQSLGQKPPTPAPQQTPPFRRMASAHGDPSARGAPTLERVGSTPGLAQRGLVMSSGGVRGGRVSDIDEVQIDMGQFGMAVGGAGVGYSDTEAGGGEGSEESDPEELWVSYASRPMQNSAATSIMHSASLPVPELPADAVPAPLSLLLTSIPAAQSSGGWHTPALDSGEARWSGLMTQRTMSVRSVRSLVSETMSTHQQSFGALNLLARPHSEAHIEMGGAAGRAVSGRPVAEGTEDLSQLQTPATHTSAHHTPSGTQVPAHASSVASAARSAVSAEGGVPMQGYSQLARSTGAYTSPATEAHSGGTETLHAPAQAATDEGTRLQAGAGPSGGFDSGGAAQLGALSQAVAAGRDHMAREGLASRDQSGTGGSGSSGAAEQAARMQAVLTGQDQSGPVSGPNVADTSGGPNTVTSSISMYQMGNATTGSLSLDWNRSRQATLVSSLDTILTLADVPFLPRTSTDPNAAQPGTPGGEVIQIGDCTFWPAQLTAALTSATAQLAGVGAGTSAASSSRIVKLDMAPTFAQGSGSRGALQGQGGEGGGGMQAEDAGQAAGLRRISAERASTGRGSAERASASHATTGRGSTGSRSSASMLRPQRSWDDLCADDGLDLSCGCSAHQNSTAMLASPPTPNLNSMQAHADPKTHTDDQGAAASEDRALHGAGGDLSASASPVQTRQGAVAQADGLARTQSAGVHSDSESHPTTPTARPRESSIDAVEFPRPLLTQVSSPTHGLGVSAASAARAGRVGSHWAFDTPATAGPSPALAGLRSAASALPGALPGRSGGSHAGRARGVLVVGAFHAGPVLHVPLKELLMPVWAALMGLTPGSAASGPHALIRHATDQPLEKRSLSMSVAATPIDTVMEVPSQQGTMVIPRSLSVLCCFTPTATAPASPTLARKDSEPTPYTPRTPRSPLASTTGRPMLRRAAGTSLDVPALAAAQLRARGSHGSAHHAHNRSVMLTGSSGRVLELQLMGVPESQDVALDTMIHLVHTSHPAYTVRLAQQHLARAQARARDSGSARTSARR